MFPWGSVPLEILSTDITQPAESLWLFIGKQHLGHWLVKCVEKISRINWKSKISFKNSMDIFLFPVKDIKISCMFYTIKKFI